MRWHKFFRQSCEYGLAWENYLLLARTLRAAWLVRRHLRVTSPGLAEAMAAVAPLYLPTQTGWRLSDHQRIARFANFVVGIPLTWGRCVQRSLIVYRLLNGYGVPARLYFGIKRDDQTAVGHAWVELSSKPGRAFGDEASDPYQDYLPVYHSPVPPN